MLSFSSCCKTSAAEVHQVTVVTPSEGKASLSQADDTDTHDPPRASGVKRGDTLRERDAAEASPRRSDSVHEHDVVEDMHCCDVGCNLMHLHCCDTSLPSPKSGVEAPVCGGFSS